MRNLYFILKIAVRNIMRHKVKNILIGIIIILTVNLILFSDNFRSISMSSWRKYVSETFTGDYNISSHSEISKDYTLTGIKFPRTYIPSEIYRYLDSHGMVYTRRIRLGGILYDYTKQDFIGFKPQTVIGCDIEKELSLMTNLVITNGKYDPSVNNGILVWKPSAVKLGLKPGSDVSFFIKDVDNNSYPYTFTVTGILDTVRSSMLEGKRGYDPIFPVFLVGYGYLADKLGVSEGDSIEVCVRDGIRSNRQNLEALAKKYGLIFFSAEKSFGILDGIVSFISIISAFICAVVIIILFVSSFNLNMMSFFERQKEIGTMYSIGAKPGWINLLLLCEMFVFSSFCSILSIAVYYALSLSFHEGFGVGPLEPAFAGSNFIFMLSLPAIAYSYAVILAVMALSAWYPIYLTYKINPVEVFNEGNI